MVRAAASLEVIQDSLDSPVERVRVAALVHMLAHGAAGRALALKVVRLLDDSSSAVQMLAVRVFGAVGQGVTEALPILMTFGERGTAPLLSRVIRCLGAIGPSAVSAVPFLKSILKRNVRDPEPLESLLAISPTDDDVMNAVVSAGLAESFRLHLAGYRFLETAEGEVIERVFAEMESRAEHGDREAQGGVSRLLYRLAAKRPERSAALLRRLLKDPTGPAAWDSVAAVGRLPSPRPRDLVGMVVQVAGMTGPARHQALTALCAIGKDAEGVASVDEVLWRTMVECVQANPLAGLEGEGARCLAAAAEAMASICPSERAVPLLTEWLNRVTASQERETSWYPVGDVLQVVAGLAPSSADVGEALLAVVAAGSAQIDENESGVLDLHRDIRKALMKLSNAESWWSKAVALGMPREDPYWSHSEPEPEELPEIPSAMEVVAAVRVRAASQGELDRLRGAVAWGRELVSVGEADEPGIVADAVDRWIRRMRRERSALAEPMAEAVGAAWGDAVQRATGWGWRVYARGGPEHLALIPEDASCVVLPQVLVSDLVQSSREVVALLLFNMIATGHYSKEAAGALRIVRG